MKSFRFFSFLLFLSLCSASYSQEITAFGTSFTYGEDVERSDAYPVKLEEKLNLEGFKLKVYNFSFSGDSTVDLLNRVNRIPKESSIVIFEYAIGNDQRVGLSAEVTEKNAAEIIKKIIDSNKRVVLILRGLNEDRLKLLVDRWTPIVKAYGAYQVTIYQPPSKNIAKNKLYYHPNPLFHNEIADKLLPVIKPLLGDKK